MAGRGAALLSLLLVATGPVAAADPAALTAERTALEAATRAMCHKRVAMLGEAAHGDARAEQFKTALIRNLVTRCGYRAVVFEASFYEFAALDRKVRAGHPLALPALGTAVGGLWKHDREFQPLLEFLAAEAGAGRLRLGGVDFQQGGAGQDYSNFGVVEELTAALPADRQATCRQTFKDHLFNGFAASRMPAVEACLTRIAQVPLPAGAGSRREAQMLRTNLSAFLRADPQAIDAYVAERDRQMAANLDYWLARWPRRTKVIIWTANAHAAQARHGSKGFAKALPFGGYLKSRFGAQLFSLGITAASGTMRWSGAPRQRQPAAPGSIEAEALAHSPWVAFVGQSWLGQQGTRPAAFFNHDWRSEPWAKLFNAAVVFDTERAAGDLRKGG